MRDRTPSELPKDTEKQGYKFVLDSIRDQLLKRKAIEESSATTPEPMPKIALNVPDDKKYFRIGEVADLIGVETYVLRYWESEFGAIRPKKSRSGQRVYERRDVQMLALVHQLLHVQKFSLQGAKQKLSEYRRAAKQGVTSPSKSVDAKILQEIARDVRQLIHYIESAI